MAAVFDRRRPAPELGVLETLLVVEGRPVELDAHLTRLAASLRELFPDRAVPRLAGKATDRCAGVALGSLRIVALPAGDRLDVEMVAGELPPGTSPSGTHALHSFVLDGGLGAHKWADRTLVDEVQARLPAQALPLILDRDGAVLEASRANVFAVRRGALFTPPLDGRILPGITRARVLAIAVAGGLETHETELSLDDLLAADEVFLTGSVRGAEPVGGLDGEELATRGELTARIAAELRRSWVDGRFG